MIRRLRFGREQRRWLLSLGLMLLAVASFRSAIADWNDVPTGSMKPTILIGDRIAVNRLAYDLKVPFTRLRLATWSHPRRGDVVILASPADGERLVKRVVGVPGDVIEMRDSRLIVNGRSLEYEAAAAGPIAGAMGSDAAGKLFFTEDLTGVRHLVAVTPSRRAVRNFGPLEIPAGKYFVMGDNRDNSADSRYFGLADRAAVAGKVTGVAFSLDYENGFKPRWSRFLRGMS